MKKTITKISTVFLALVMLFTTVAPTTVYAAVPKKTNITSISVRDQKVSLKWKKVSNAKKYQIQYSTSSKFKNAKITTTSSRSKTVGSLKPSKTYYFRVRGVKGKRKGKWSAKRKIKTKTAKPTTPVITGIKAGKNYLTVSWSKSKRVSGYQLQYSTNNKFKSATTLNVSKKSNTRKITGLKKNKRYYIRVRAYHNYQKKTYRSSWSGASNKKTNSSSKTNADNSNLTFTTLIPNKLKIDNKGRYWALLDKEYDDPDDPFADHSNGWIHYDDKDEFYKLLYKTYQRINMPNDANDYEKLMIMCRYINENYHYAYKSDGVTPDTKYCSTYDLVKYNKSVCAGFSAWVWQYCDFYNIPCYMVEGMTEAGLHAWNVIGLNNYWYVIDTTGDGGIWATISKEAVKYPNGAADFPDSDVMQVKVNEYALGCKKTAEYNPADYCYPIYESWFDVQKSLGNSVSESDKELHKHDYYITEYPADRSKSIRRKMVSVNDSIRYEALSYKFDISQHNNDDLKVLKNHGYKNVKWGSGQTIANDWNAFYSAAVACNNHKFK